jgi:hypothetical protein
VGIKTIKTMARIKKGILGGFSGKVGTVVGANWKEIAYMRSLPQKVKNPRTEAQLKQRAKFVLVVSLLKPLTAFLRIGWKLYANRQSAFNACTKYTLANAVTGTYPNQKIDLEKLLVTRGNLPSVTNPLLGTNGKVITMQWGNNSNIGTAKSTDKALAVVINQTTGEAMCITDGVNRSAGKQDVTLPVIWDGCDIFCYAGFISEDGKEVSNSYCYGQHKVSIS